MMTMTIDAMQVREPTATLLRDPASAHAECADMAQLAQEAFAVLTLNTKNKLIARHLVSLGLVNSAPVHPREIFRHAISDGAEAVILAHNHPSGDPTPSAEDLRVTRQLIEAGKVIGIRVLDHVIIGRGDMSHLSLREKGLVTFDP
jgi:DNA repair protein RadC